MLAEIVTTMVHSSSRQSSSLKNVESLHCNHRYEKDNEYLIVCSLDVRLFRSSMIKAERLNYTNGSYSLHKKYQNVSYKSSVVV